MLVILLDASSPLGAEACALHDAGQARLVLVDGTWTRPFEGVQPGDRALVGTSVPSFFLHHLLHACVHGKLAAVGLVVDSWPVDTGRTGFRWGPWLRGVYAPEDLELVLPSPLPAPGSTFSRLADLPAAMGPPPVLFTERPSPFPERLQLQTTSRCVRGCTYCPKPRQTLPDVRMEEALFDRIIDECARFAPASLELYLHAEPLEDPRLERLATRAKAACPTTMVSVTTHERAVDAERVASLADSGLDVVFVSVNAAGQTNEAALRRRLEAVANLAPLMRAKGKELVVVTLTNLLPQGLRGTFRKLCRALDLPLEAYRATSRAGDARLRPRVRVFSSSEGCLRPYTTAHILADGRMVSCCEDWQYRRVFGDVGEASVAEVWNGEAARDLRNELLRGRLTEPCDRCDILAERRIPDT